MSARLQFLGATGTVTGSKYLVETRAARMLVDCGLFQGFKDLRLRNWSAPPFSAAAISAVVLTHAHLDHSGYLPLLVRNGFVGPIFCSPATFDLCRILLPDAGRLQEEEAQYANRHGYSKHKPARPLYTEEDATRALARFHPVNVDKPFDVAGMRATLHPSGHILGACLVVLEHEGRRTVFSGDLGRPNDPVMVPPARIESADTLVLESTYGNRAHDPSDPADKLGETIRRAAARRGVVLIPSFAVGRSQSLLYHLAQLKSRSGIPRDLPIYLNSPMAVDATALYLKHRGAHRLDPQQCRAMCRAAVMVNSVEESKRLNERHGPMVIIAASGMATGGRVTHHLKAFASDPRNTILFSGYQAAGTRGARILAGDRSVKIHGEQVPIRAEVAHLDNLSAHADAEELLGWLGGFRTAPSRVFLTHGEPLASDALRIRIAESLGWNCEAPRYLQSAALG